MGEGKRRRLHPMHGPTLVRPRVDLDVAIEEFEALVEAGKVRGIVQIAVCETSIPGTSELKLMTFGLEKQEAFDALTMLYREAKAAFGFKEPGEV